MTDLDLKLLQQDADEYPMVPSGSMQRAIGEIVRLRAALGAMTASRDEAIGICDVALDVTDVWCEGQVERLQRRVIELRTVGTDAGTDADQRDF